MLVCQKIECGYFYDKDSFDKGNGTPCKCVITPMALHCTKTPKVFWFWFTKIRQQLIPPLPQDFTYYHVNKTIDNLSPDHKYLCLNVCITDVYSSAQLLLLLSVTLIFFAFINNHVLNQDWMKFQTGESRPKMLRKKQQQKTTNQA